MTSVQRRAPMAHDLKTWPGPFRAVQDGVKTFEYRKADRDYREGDTLHLREWAPLPPSNPATGGIYIGGQITVTVTYILHGPDYDIPDGYCIMGIKPVEQPDDVREHNRTRALALAAVEHGVSVMLWRGTYSPCHADHPTDRRLAGLGSFGSPLDALAAAAIVLRLQLGPVPQEYDQAPTAADALRQIASASANWQVNVGSYAGGETYAGFAGRLQQIARDALTAMSLNASTPKPQEGGAQP